MKTMGERNYELQRAEKLLVRVLGPGVVLLVCVILSFAGVHLLIALVLVLPVYLLGTLAGSILAQRPDL